MRAQAVRIKTKFKLGKVRRSNFIRDEREIRIEYSDAKRRYIYRDLGRIMRQTISYQAKQLSKEESLNIYL